MAPPDPLTDRMVELIGERLSAIAEPMRIRLLEQLREGELTVTELTHRTGFVQQTVSKHLGVLLRAGWVARRKQGVSVYYRLVDESAFDVWRLIASSIHEQWSTLGRELDR